MVPKEEEEEGVVVLLVVSVLLLPLAGVSKRTRLGVGRSVALAAARSSKNGSDEDEDELVIINSGVWKRTMLAGVLLAAPLEAGVALEAGVRLVEWVALGVESEAADEREDGVG